MSEFMEIMKAINAIVSTAFLVAAVISLVKGDRSASGYWLIWAIFTRLGAQ